MALRITAGARLFAALTLAGAMGALGTAPAVAEPASPSIPLGMKMVVNDVLGPQDPGFWDPAVPGTRVWTPVAPGVVVACATGFVPVISCATSDARTPQRTLLFVDVPVPGGPLRVWFDVPQPTDLYEWNNGSVGDLLMRFLER